MNFQNWRQFHFGVVTKQIEKRWLFFNEIKSDKQNSPFLKFVFLAKFLEKTFAIKGDRGRFSRFDFSFEFFPMKKLPLKSSWLSRYSQITIEDFSFEENLTIIKSKEIVRVSVLFMSKFNQSEN